MNFGGMCALPLSLVWFLCCIKATYLKGDCKREDRAALHQRPCTWVRRAAHVEVLFSPHSPIPRQHYSQCFAWAHKISALPRLSFLPDITLLFF